MKIATPLFALLTLLNACVSQDRPAAATTPFVLEAGETKLSDLIDRAAAYLQWNILTTDQEMAAAAGGPSSVRLQRRLETDVPGCEDVLTSILYRSGFALTALDEQKSLYEVISMNGPRNREVLTRAARRTPEQILARPSLKVPVTTVVQLQHTNANIATNAMRPFFAMASGPGGSSLTIGTIGNNSGLILSGMQDQVATVLALVKVCDVEQAPEEVPGLADRVAALESRLQMLEQRLAAPQKR